METELELVPVAVAVVVFTAPDELDVVACVVVAMGAMQVLPGGPGVQTAGGMQALQNVSCSQITCGLIQQTSFAPIAVPWLINRCRRGSVYIILVDDQYSSYQHMPCPTPPNITPFAKSRAHQVPLSGRQRSVPSKLTQWFPSLHPRSIGQSSRTQRYPSGQEGSDEVVTLFTSLLLDPMGSSGMLMEGSKP